MKRKTLFNLILGLTILGSDYFVAFAKGEGYIKHSVIPNLSGLKQINQTQSIRPETVRDSGLERAIIRQGQIPKEFINNIRYYYNRVDLNGDNKPEVLVHLIGQYFCGSGGCTTLIFQFVGQDYRLVSTISLSTAPIIVTNQKNLGWNNLITLAAGGSWGSNQGYYLLRFNGKSYPNNTGDGIKLRPNSTMTGRAFFSNLDYSNGGIALQPQNSQITAGRSSSGQQTTTRRTPNTRRSATSSNTTARPTVPTWNQFVASLQEGDYINTDFDLPQEFRNGYVYRVQGANWVGVYILKAGLPSYPLPVTSELSQITDGERYVQSGQAIFLLWDLSFSAPRNANDTQVRFSEKGLGCLRNTCLTARSMSNTQIIRILLSERPISQPSVAASNTQRSPSSGEQTGTGRSTSSGEQTGTGRSQSSTPSLMRAANFQSVRGVIVEPAKEPIRDFRQLKGNYSFILDRVNSRKLPDGREVFSFDVYNTGYADGVIEVRNARAELVEIRAIEGVRNPTNPISFGSFSIQKQWDSFTDFMNGRWFNDPRFATAQQKKTTIENIALPPGGSITFTKTGANAQAYNQATLVMGFFFGGWLSESEENPASLPGALNRIFGEDATFKQKFLAALFLKFQEKRIGSLVKEGAFQDLPSTLQAFTTASWIEEQNFNELVKTGIEVFLQEGIKHGITDRVLKEKLFGASLKSWVTAAEIFAKGGNVFLQNLDLERSKIAEEKKGPLAIIYPR
ncbi:hypothetical protein [Floridanema aerugineum]|uniref:Uncharacterized protein n=1 Tax=Floridaenema aerugineum BLCC-F46 TaxID=3153654 RepID=A0ABV4X7C8_9CYAN